MTCSLLLLAALLLAPLGICRGQSIPTRTLAFTTTEGTWLSLDVAPTGDRLVMELLGDVYRLPISGGRAVPILTGTPFQSQPRFSPNGAQLAYISDESGSDNVWIANADGTAPRQLTTRPRAVLLSPAWSADGRAIYVTLVDDIGPRVAEIWRFDVASGEGSREVENSNGMPAPLVSSPAPGAYGAALAADGTALLYASVTPRMYGSRNGAASQVVRRDLATGQASPLPLLATLPMRPALSRDGRWLVFGAVHEGVMGLKVRDMTTGDERWLRRGIDRHELESRATRDVLPGYAFAPDGESVYVAFGGRIHRLGVRDSSDTVIPFSADVALAITPRLELPLRVDTGAVRARRLQHLAVAADGRVAFSALARIYVAPRDGRTPARLTRTLRPREFMPAWSPDGRWIAYVTWDETGGALWKAPVDGRTEPQRLSAGPALWIDPVWSPQGDSIVAITAPLGSSRLAPPPIPPGARMSLPPDARIVAVPAAGGAERTVAPAGGLRSPHFAGATVRLYLTSPAAGLESVAMDGTGRRVEATLARELGRGSLFLSPDGSHVAALVDRRLLRFERQADGVVPTTLVASAATMLSDDTPGSIAWGADGAQLSWLTGSTVSTMPTAHPAPGARVAPAGPRDVAVRVEVPRAASSGTIVLRGATVVTMRGDEIVENADVVVRAGRVAFVGRRGDAPVPVGARVIDVAGKVIVPGFIDLHAHIGVTPDLLQPEWTGGFANLAYGITTLRDPQAPPDIFAVADIIDADGVPAPRVFSTGPALALSFSGGHYTGTSLQSLDEVRQAMRTYRDEYDTRYLKSYLIGNRQQRQWVVQAARELGLLVTTEGGADAKANLTHAMDGFAGNEHALPVAPLYDDVVQLLAQAGIAYTPTLVVAFGAGLPIFRLHAAERAHTIPKVDRWYPTGDLYERSQTRLLSFPPQDYNDREAGLGATAILRAGGHVALGGHGEVQGLSNHWEMALLAGGGMTPLEVLRVATLEGALALGLGADLGSLEPGKLADLVVLDRDPLLDIRATTAVRYVMKGGVLYEGETLDEVWPVARRLARPWALVR